MKYCGQCGARVSFIVPVGDNRQRHVCDECGEIHYSNPRIIAGTLPVSGNQVLLCRRAIEPRKGFWTLPAGFMENGETVTAAAQRETQEEAEANVTIDGLYTIFNLPHISQVYMFFRADLGNNSFGAGPESLEVALFNENEIPWDDLAFRVVERTLRLYFEDRQQNDYPVRVEDVEPRLSLKRSD